jgi:ferrous iron transport protein B
LEQSYLGRFGRSIEPAFKPAGFDWRITTAILSAFPARETVVPSMKIIFGAEAEMEDQKFDKVLASAKWPDGKPLFTTASSFSLMVFFALCAQCFSTLAVVKRETNSIKWPIIMFVYMTALAYLGSVIVMAVFGP